MYLPKRGPNDKRKKIREKEIREEKNLSVYSRQTVRYRYWNTIRH